MQSISDFKNYMLACTWPKLVMMYLQYLHLTDISYMEAKSSFSRQEIRKHKSVIIMWVKMLPSVVTHFLP